MFKNKTKSAIIIFVLAIAITLLTSLVTSTDKYTGVITDRGWPLQYLSRSADSTHCAKYSYDFCLSPIYAPFKLDKVLIVDNLALWAVVITVAYLGIEMVRKRT